MAWVTDPFEVNPRETPLSYRFHATMMGSLRLGANLNAWSEANKAEAKTLINLYKNVRDTIQHGRHYRLRSFRDGPVSATQFVDATGDNAVVFVFLHSATFGPYLCQLRLQGLQSDYVYELEDYGVLSGEALMQRGLRLELKGTFKSKLIRVTRKP